jgi:hypothetical protein
MTHNHYHCTTLHIKSSNDTLSHHRLISCTLLYSSSLLLACCTLPACCCTPPAYHYTPAASTCSFKVKVTLRLTVSQSVSLDVEPICGSWPDIYYFLTVTVLFLWGALSDERTDLSFVYAAGARQRSLSRVRVSWDSWPYFAVSDLRLPFSPPPTTRGVTVGEFEPASTRVSSRCQSQSQIYVTTDASVGQSVLE